MTPEEITAMAEKMAICFSADSFEFTNDGLLAFAALVAEKAAAQERERLFGTGRPLDGEMCVSIKRWSGGECFAYATRFTAAQTLSGLDGLLQKSVLRMADDLEAAIRARGTKEGV